MFSIATLKRHAPWLIPLVLLAAYVIIAAIRLRYPGTQYDEALYLNAARGGVDQTTFMTKTFHGFPVLLMPYIGALKAYIFYPIFAVFGVSAISMRLPVILLTAFGLFIMYRLLLVQVGRRLSVCILALTALDASFIVFTRLDNGPVVLDFLLKIIALFALLRFLRSRQLWLLGVFWFALFLGVFNKINFIWYVNAFPVAFVLIYGRQLWGQLKHQARLRVIAVSAAGYLLNVIYYLYINHRYHLGTHFGFVGWQTIHINLITLIGGSWFYHYALSPAALGTDAIFWIMLTTSVTGTICLAYYSWRRRALFDSRFTNFFWFVGAAFVLLIGQVCMTREATAGWHYFTVYPLFGTLFVLSLAILGKALLPKRRQLVSIGIVVITALFCAYQLNIYRYYVIAYGKPVTNPIWSSAIYSLIDYTKAHHNTEFMSLDWGTQTQLIGYDSVPNKYYEVLGPILINDPAQNSLDFQNYIASKPGGYYIAHAAGVQLMPTATQFFALARQHGYQPHLVKTISDGGRPIFDIYQLQK